MKIGIAVVWIALLSSGLVSANPAPQVPLLSYSPSPRRAAALTPQLEKLKRFGESLRHGPPQLTEEEKAELFSLLDQGFLNLQIDANLREDRILKLKIASALFPDNDLVQSPEQLINVPHGVSLIARINAFLQTRHMATPEMDEYLFKCAQKALEGGIPGLRMAEGYWDWRTPQGFNTTEAHFQQLLGIERSFSDKKIEIVSIMDFTQRAFRQAYPLYLKPTAKPPLSLSDILARAKQLIAAERSRGEEIPATMDWLHLHKNHQDAFYLYFEVLKHLERMALGPSPFAFYKSNVGPMSHHENIAQIWEALAVLKITKESDRKGIQDWLSAPRRAEADIAPVLQFLPEIFSYAEVTLPAKYLSWMRLNWRTQIAVVEGAAWHSFDFENPEKKTYSLNAVDTQREQRRKEFVESRSREVKAKWVEVVFDSLDQVTVQLASANTDEELTQAQDFFWDGVMLIEDLSQTRHLRNVLSTILAFQVQFRQRSNAVGGTQLMWEQTRAVTQWFSKHRTPKDKSLVEAYILNLQKKNLDKSIASEAKWIGILSGIEHWRIGVNDTLPDLDRQELDIARVLFTRQRSQRHLMSCSTLLLRKVK